ncbi:TPA: apolipoprotein N-acyltransferase [Candidatus Poribacteria bacterium]|nr:apolipoprotein N-acyltransferase [Candidatus Poribacteria bacterium]
MNWGRVKKGLLLSSISGVLLVLSTAGIGWYPLAWIAIIPLLIAIKSAKNTKSAFLIGYLSGSIHFLGTAYWIALLYPYANTGWFVSDVAVTTILYLLLSLYLAVYSAVFAVVLRRLTWSVLPMIFVSATIWTACEWIASWLLTGFPWGSLGYTQWKNLPVIQISSIFGIHGVSFVIVLFNATGAELIHARTSWRVQIKYATVPLIIILMVFVFGVLVMRPVEFSDVSKIKIGIIPGNIRQIDKWQNKNFDAIFRKYLNLIKEVSDKHSDLSFITLAETAIPQAIFYNQENMYQKALKQLLRDQQLNLLAGTPNYSEGKAYNSVFLLNSKGDQAGVYSKMHLVPFGEYTPIASFFPDLIQESGWEAGKSYDIFPIPSTLGLEMGVAICYESSFPNLVRRFVKKGAVIIGVLTNDAWFEGTAAPTQHLSMAPFRAVENRVSVFRCANGGISCIIDEFGRVGKEQILPEDQDGFLIGSIALKHQKKETIYTLYGDWFPIACFVISLGLIGFLLLLQFGIINNYDSGRERSN